MAITAPSSIACRWRCGGPGLRLPPIIASSRAGPIRPGRAPFIRRFCLSPDGRVPAAMLQHLELGCGRGGGGWSSKLQININTNELLAGRDAALRIFTRRAHLRHRAPVTGARRRNVYARASERASHSDTCGTGHGRAYGRASGWGRLSDGRSGLAQHLSSIPVRFRRRRAWLRRSTRFCAAPPSSASPSDRRRAAIRHCPSTSPRIASQAPGARSRPALRWTGVGPRPVRNTAARPMRSPCDAPSHPLLVLGRACAPTPRQQGHLLSGRGAREFEPTAPRATFALFG